MKKNITPINDRIRAEKVMLIGVSGEKHGVVDFSEAMESAKTASLDLVQVSPSDADPVVCKLLDYGKYVFDKKKMSAQIKRKLKEIQLKK